MSKGSKEDKEHKMSHCFWRTYRNHPLEIEEENKKTSMRLNWWQIEGDSGGKKLWRFEVTIHYYAILCCNILVVYK